MSITIRTAEFSDLDAVSRIYNDIHTAEEAGICTIGWLRDVYPTRKTAEDAISRQDLFVLEEDESGSALDDEISNGVFEGSSDGIPDKTSDRISGRIVGAAIINQIQVDVYADAPWEFDTDQVCVLHTLVISPEAAGKGYGTAFVSYYENMALEHGLPELRIDTNARNTAARKMYHKLGYKEIAVVPVTFNGIPGVDLVLLEKNLDR